MTLADIHQQFSHCQSWEERYRLLIQLSRQLPKPSESELSSWQEIHGCESRLWFHFQITPRQVQAYSDARFMQGLLVMLITALQEVDHTELAQFNISEFFARFHITPHLTSTRLNGLRQLERLIQQATDK